jgi:hypothetical protein
MNLTEQEAAKVIEALEVLTAHIGCPPGDNATADAYWQGLNALAILQAAKDRPQPAVDRLIEAGDAMHDEHRANDAGNGSSEKGRMDMYRAWDAAKSAAPAQRGLTAKLNNP